MHIEPNTLFNQICPIRVFGHEKNVFTNWKIEDVKSTLPMQTKQDHEIGHKMKFYSNQCRLKPPESNFWIFRDKNIIYLPNLVILLSCGLSQKGLSHFKVLHLILTALELKEIFTQTSSFCLENESEAKIQKGKEIDLKPQGSC